MRYRRNFELGGTYFFTVVTAARKPWLTEAPSIRLLRAAFGHIRRRRPFDFDAVVILPDHLHVVWTLPEDDQDYSGRWRLIKTYVSKRLATGKPLWQPRFWEHTIRNTHDYRHHLDYIHYNPVKHGLVSAPRDWSYSSFSRYVKEGTYARDWGETAPEIPAHIGRE